MATKQDPDSKRVDKALKLYRLLLINDRKYSTTELTKILNCSKQSIRAVIDDLNANPEINICEEFNEHTRVKKYFIEHSKHGMNEPIALEGYRQMELCRDLIGELLPEDDLLELNKALFNAANYLPRKARCNFKTFSIANGLSKGHINYSNSKEILHKLYDCITQKKCCMLSYQKEVKALCVKLVCDISSIFVSYFTFLNVTAFFSFFSKRGCGGKSFFFFLNHF